MANTVYTYRIFQDNSFTTPSSEILEISTEPYKLLKNSLFDSIRDFPTTFNKIRIPAETHQFLIKLLVNYNLSAFLGEFATFVSAVQQQYITYMEVDFDNVLFKDFQDERLDLVKLLEVLEKYVFEENKLWIGSLKLNIIKEEEISGQLKWMPGGSVNIDNFFVVDTILSAICDGLELKRDNFEEKKLQLLEGSNSFLYQQASQTLKKNVATFLYNLLRDSSIKGHNELCKFIGLILHLCQIPIKIKDESIEIDFEQDVKYNLRSIPFRNISHLIKKI